MAGTSAASIANDTPDKADPRVIRDAQVLRRNGYSSARFRAIYTPTDRAEYSEWKFERDILHVCGDTVTRHTPV